MRRLLLILLTTIVAVSAFAQDRYEALVDSADMALSREQWARAESFLGLALREHPGSFGNALLLSNLGVARTRLGDYQGALEAFEAGLGITPRSTVILSNRARTFLEMGQPAKAVPDLSAALAVDPKLDWCRKMRALVNLQLGNPEAAREDFRTVADANPSDPDALAGMAECAVALGDPEEAEKWFAKAVEADPGDPDLRFSFAFFLLEHDLTVPASRQISEGLALDPSSGNLHLLRAALCRKLYQVRECQEALREARRYGADIELVRYFFPEKMR